MDGEGKTTSILRFYLYFGFHSGFPSHDDDDDDDDDYDDGNAMSRKS